ncbi:rhodopsin-like [Oscarella lobularis]|uniref:rhodopsin-like n=1 Tax=Oscarella lobularis TaxID=121494 RepID=UPI003314048E
MITNVSANKTDDDQNAALQLVRTAFLYANLAPGIIETLLCTIVLVSTTRRRKARQSPPNVLVLVSAACDLIRGIHTCFSPTLYKESGVDDTRFNTIACQIYQWVHAFQYAASFWLMATLAYSRYDVVARPINPRLTMRRMWGLIVAVTAISATFATLPLVGWNRYWLRKLKNGNYRCSGTDSNAELSQRAYVPVYFGINSLVPIIIIAIFLAGIVPIATRSEKWKKRRNDTIRRRQGDDADAGADDVANPRDVIASKAFRYVVFIVLTNVVLSAPFVSIKVAREFSGKKIGDYAIPVCKVLLSVNNIANSVLYVFWARTFQDSLTSVLCFWKRASGRDRGRSESKSSSNSQREFRTDFTIDGEEIIYV